MGDSWCCVNGIVDVDPCPLAIFTAFKLARRELGRDDGRDDARVEDDVDALDALLLLELDPTGE